MYLLITLLLCYLGVSLIATIVIYAACVASGRMRDLENNRKPVVKRYTERVVKLARRIRPVG
jgi:hypothetical protein